MRTQATVTTAGLRLRSGQRERADDLAPPGPLRVVAGALQAPPGELLQRLRRAHRDDGAGHVQGRAEAELRDGKVVALRLGG